MAQTLTEALLSAAPLTHKGYTFLDGKLEERPWTFQGLAAEAERRARHFQRLGLCRGDRVAMVIPDGEDFVLTFFGVIRAGGVPVPMYPPLALNRIDAYVASAQRILQTAGARLLVTNQTIGGLIWSLVGSVDSLEDVVQVERLRKLDEQALPPFEDPQLRPEDVCFLQFTSGSTSAPKGVQVTHASLMANAHAIMKDGISADAEVDHGVSWLPLYHDMGLIGFVVSPLVAQIRVTFIPTELFVKRPNVWMKTVDEVRGTISFAPNFAFGLAAKRASRMKVDALDLSCLRVVGCGAEPINPRTLEAFIDTFAPAQLNPAAVMPAYGMAEATLAITFDGLEERFRALRIDRARYERESVAVPASEDARPDEYLELVDCGLPFPGHEVGVMDDDDRLLEEGQVGEIVLKGPSNAAGYHDNPDASADLFRSGWLHTGDLGFKKDGCLFISGRKKDLIILNGRNYYPQSIEWELENVEGIRKGNVVAFGVTGERSEELVVVAETRSEDRVSLAQAVRQHLTDALSLRPRDIVLLGPGSLPKTSSGKLQRRRAKTLYESSELGQEGNRTIGSAASRWSLAKHVASSAATRLVRSVKPGRRSNTPRS
ncbi:MAG: fatty acyl-AMP ligase [Myxococcota bacterium]